MMKFVNGEFVPVEVKSHFDTAQYHAANGGRASEAVKKFVAEHDSSNSYNFDYNDVCDLYALSLEHKNYDLDIEDIIVTAIYAGMCAAEWATPPEIHENEKGA